MEEAKIITEGANVLPNPAVTNGALALTAKTIEQNKRKYTYRELLELKVEEQPMLFAPVFLKEGFAVCYGAPDCGKSLFLRQMCECVAMGRDFLGFAYKGIHHKAIYFSSEDDATRTANVITYNQRAMQLTEEAMDNLRFVFDWSADELVPLLEEALTEAPADLVVIDAWGDAFDGKNMNDALDVRRFYGKLKPIISKYGCFVIFNHHTNKSALKYAPGKESASGSEAVLSAPRLGFEIRRDPTAPTLTHLCITKGNYLSIDYKIASFAMDFNADSLTFALNGSRIPFADLAKAERSVTYCSKKPDTKTDDEHKRVIKDIFAKNPSCNMSQLCSALCDAFGISDKPSRDYVALYVAQKWVLEEQGKGRVRNFKCNI